MQVIQLEPSEIARVYRSHLRRDFPVDELKPLFVIKGHLKNHFYQAFGLFSDSAANALMPDGRPDLRQLLAYAFCCGSDQPGSLLLLDYFAVRPDRRGQGLGSQFLGLLIPHLSLMDGLVAEVESIASADDEAERQTRRRRLDFYIQAGFRHTAVQGNIFTVDYDIVYRPIQNGRDDQQLLASLEQLYRTMLPASLFRRMIHLTSG